MKNLLLILLFIPLVSFGQRTKSIQVCSLTQISINGTESEEAYDDVELETILKKIFAVIKPYTQWTYNDITLKVCNDINNAAVVKWGGQHFIIIDKEYVGSFNYSEDNYINYAFNLAHELGHLIIEDNAASWLTKKKIDREIKELSGDFRERKEKELEADEFAGFVLSKLGVSMDVILKFMEDTEVEVKINRVYNGNTHGSHLDRLNAVNRGYRVNYSFKDSSPNDNENYVNDLKQGEVKTYYELGRLRYTENYVDGLKQGEGKYYFKSGRLQFTENYVDGLKQGEWKAYYESGELQSTENYVDDLKQGDVNEYFKSGKLRFTINYVDGLSQGEGKTYYESGGLKYIYNYVDGLKQGQSKIYYESGVLKGTETLEDSMIKGEVKKYYKSGILKSTANFEDGLKQGESKDYYKSGELQSTANYVDGVMQGESKEYYESGELEYTENYVDGVKQ